MRGEEGAAEKAKFLWHNIINLEAPNQFRGVVPGKSTITSVKNGPLYSKRVKNNFKNILRSEGI